MVNNIVLVGTIKGDYKILVDKPKHKLLELSVLVQKPFKNDNGHYDVDVIPVKVWSNVINNLDQDLIAEELICIKGRIGSFSFKNKTGKLVYYPEIIAERLINLMTDE